MVPGLATTDRARVRADDRRRGGSRARLQRVTATTRGQVAEITSRRGRVRRGRW